MAKKTYPLIPPPIVLSVSEAKKWFALWNTLPNYSAQEIALLNLFGPTSPYRANNNLINTQIKVSVLNDFYSTSLKSSFLMAEHISHIPFCDKKLAAGNISLVDDIRKLNITFANGVSKTFDYYSFATKYCCMHEPSKYPIFDSFVAKLIIYLSRHTSIPFNFKYQTKLKDYSVFKEQIDIIIKHFNLQSLTYREVDHYLWLIAKRCFAKPSKIFPQPNYNQFNIKP